jgi:TatA/E family protein of Tat protein translocase
MCSLGLLPVRSGIYDESMNLGFPEMIFIFFVALVIFGPKKLPEIGRQIGKALNEFKRASNEFKSQIEAEISQIDLENKRQILPPSQPPVGALAALPEPAASAGTSELSSEPAAEQPLMAKAPDA